MNILKILPLAALLLSACHTTKNIQNTTEHTKAIDNAEAAYKRKVVQNAQTANYLTSRVKVNINAAGKNISCNGRLNMKRNDVIQLSLSFLGFEVGRLEFTPQNVLLIDRVNKQYCRGNYNEVRFLQQANLDFYSLQAIFWNEIFVPGQHNANNSLNRFHLSSAGDHTLLSLPDAPKLDYQFLTQTSTALLDRITVQNKQAGQKGQLVCKYAAFTNVGGKPFPKSITLNITGLGKDAQLDIELTGPNNNSDWETRTTVKDTYKQRSADDILGRLIQMN